MLDIINKAKKFLDADEDVTLINKGASYVGKLETEKDVWVDGDLVTETLKCRSLTVGKEGCVQGNVEVEELIVYGSYYGNALACSVSAHKGSLIEGEIMYKTMNIDDGSVISGTLKHTGV